MNLKFTFPVDIEEIYEILTDPQFLVDGNVALGDVDSECDAEESGSDVVIKMTRTRAMDLPGFLANVLGASQVFSTEELWQVADDHYEGSSTTVVQGQSGTVRTEFSLIPTKKGCEYKIAHTAKIKIPVVGRRVEKYIVNAASEDVKKEMKYLRSELG